MCKSLANRNRTSDRWITFLTEWTTTSTVHRSTNWAITRWPFSLTYNIQSLVQDKIYKITQLNPCFSKLRYKKEDNKLAYIHSPAKHILSLHLLISISKNYQFNYNYNTTYLHNYNCCVLPNSQITLMYPNFNVFYICVYTNQVTSPHILVPFVHSL